MLLTILFYISVLIIGAGIWMIVETYFSKDRSGGMISFLGMVVIVIGLVLLLISDIPDFKSPSNIENPNSVNVVAPPKSTLKQ